MTQFSPNTLTKTKKKSFKSYVKSENKTMAKISTKNYLLPMYTGKDICLIHQSQFLKP